MSIKEYATLDDLNQLREELRSQFLSGTVSWTWEDDFKDWTEVPLGNGLRFSVQFPRVLAAIPQVHLSISALDLSTGLLWGAGTKQELGDHTHSVRLHSITENVSKTGFDIYVRSWSNSRTYGFTINWIAFLGQGIECDTPPIRDAEWKKFGQIFKK